MIGLRLFILLIVAMLAGCATQSNNTAGSGTGMYAADTSRTIDLTNPPNDMWDRIRRGFTIPNYNSELTDYWTQYYASHPESVLLMSQRAGKYLYHIVDELNRRGMPTELALLPFVESAYNPTALSRSQASGLWQFIPSTGRHFNLRQDWWRDDRRDPIASTNAALDYFTYLYDFQGDWYLALASYNWGEGAVRRAMDRNADAGQATDYASLKLPEETRNYVPKLQAIKNIISNPRKYGITLPAVRNTPYFTTVKKTQNIDIEVAAQLAEMSVDEFRSLNAAFNRPVIVADHNPVLLIPTDKLARFQANLANYDGPLTSWETYRPRKGESLSAIAKKHGITVAELKSANGIGSRQSRATSPSLLVPARNRPGAPQGGIQLVSLNTSAATNASSSPSTDIRIVRRSPNVRVHTVRSGDTLYGLAKRYNTSVTELRRLNNLKGSKLSLGTKLRVPGTDVRG
jgi:membrane-bound lytic murein transglycosylase D